MNAKTLLFIATIIASGNVFAERMGRDSVYANGTGMTAAKANSAINLRAGRDSVYATSKGPGVSLTKTAALNLSARFGRS